MAQAVVEHGLPWFDRVRTLMLEADHFRRIARENGDIGLAVIQVLSERLRVATERESALRLLMENILRQRVVARP